MAPNNSDQSRRDGDHHEQNPFIAFRHFADAQVSSLLNAVFTLPAALANAERHGCPPPLQRDMHEIRNKLIQEMTTELVQLSAQVEQAHRAKDWERAVALRDRHAAVVAQRDHLRRLYLGEEPENDAAIVERVANRKGQEWAWSWSWGFPQPFDNQGQEMQDNGEEDHPHRRVCRWRHRRHGHDEDAQRQAQEEPERSDSRWDDFRTRMNEDSEHDRRTPKVWSWSFNWPPQPADAPGQHKPARDDTTVGSVESIWAEIGHAVLDEEAARPLRPHPSFFPDCSYTPHALGANVNTAHARVSWRDAFEDLIRIERGAPLMPAEQLGQSARMPYNQWVERFQSFPTLGPIKPSKTAYPKRVPWEGEETSEEPSYEYAHDHEDQHDDPPTPKPRQGEFTKAGSATEQEAYERLLGPVTTPSGPSSNVRSSILSTLTTTERSVAPDGSVTTKVVLKKRFADGREESSETVHTHRGQETDNQVQDPWKAMQQAQFPPTKPAEAPREAAKKTTKGKAGWFWSN